LRNLPKEQLLDGEDRRATRAQDASELRRPAPLFAQILAISLPRCIINLTASVGLSTSTTMSYILLGDLIAVWGTLLIGSLFLVSERAPYRALLLIVVGEAILFTSFFAVFVSSRIYGIADVSTFWALVGATGITIATRQLVNRIMEPKIALWMPLVLGGFTFLGVVFSPLFTGVHATQIVPAVFFGLALWLAGLCCGLFVRPSQSHPK